MRPLFCGEFAAYVAVVGCFIDLTVAVKSFFAACAGV